MLCTAILLAGAIGAAWLVLVQSDADRDAIPALERNAVEVKSRRGADHPDYATALNTLGQALQNANRLAEAEPIMRRALAIDEASLGPEHPSVARDLSNLARLLWATNRYTEAEPLYRRAAAILETKLGPDTPDLAAVLNNLAALLRDTNRLAQAEPLFRRALAIDEKALGPDHRDVAFSLVNLGDLLESANRHIEAEPLYRRALAIDEKALGPDHPSVARDLKYLAGSLQATNQHAEAEPLYRRAASILETKLGPEDPNLATVLGDLSALLQATNRYAEAEPLIRRALAIDEKIQGPEHPSVARDLGYLAGLLQLTNRYAEAEPLYRRALTIAETKLGPDDPRVGKVINDLATLLRATDQLAEAERLMRRAVDIAEKSLGPDHPDMAGRLRNLAELLGATNRLVEAESLSRRALAIREKVLGPDHPNVADSLNGLALLLLHTNRHADAEPLFQRALAINEKRLGPEHPDVAIVLNNLAELLRETGRLAEAEPVMRRALAVRERSLGPEHPLVATGLGNLATLLDSTNRRAEAEPLHRRALAINEKIFGPDHPRVAVVLNNLAGLLLSTSRLAEAEQFYRRALAISEQSFGPEHPTVATRLNNLAELLKGTGRVTDAEPLYRRALAITEKSYGPDHPEVANRLNSLAEMRAEVGAWAEAAELHRRAKPIMTGRSGGTGNTLAKAALRSNIRDLRLAARAVHRTGEGSAEAREEGFELAQWALQSGAADALAQMAARFAKGAGPLAEQVREQQDLIARRQSEDKRLLEAIGIADAKATSALRASIAGLDAKLAAIDRRLAAEFPEYASLVSPKPLDIGTVQGLLREDEALIVFLDVPSSGKLSSETLAWAATKREARWIHLPFGTEVLATGAGILRCGLDETMWEGGLPGDPCFDTLKTAPYRAVVDGRHLNFLPFDLAVAHGLYEKLLGPFEDLIKGKHLLIVPSEPLASLPFQVLVTEPPQADIPRQPDGATDGAWLKPYRDAAWLGLRQPISVLPAVASLKAAREFAKVSSASKPYLGIGNPLLDGDDPKGAEAARARQRCPVPAAERLVASLRGRRGPASFRSLFRGTQVDVGLVRAQTPLPETAEELCEIGQRLAVLASEILLGAGATETAVKELSERGSLAQARIVHFATHGALAGQLGGSAEPGLILTPPPQGTVDRQALERDDGYLTASEIATLKLDADWVILSACNTAGGQHAGENAEALSGLARAFLYAGARALLVSHWAVDSEASVKLTTGAFAALAVDPGIGRAEALRRSMRELIVAGRPENAHPYYWAPFVLVDGGAR